MQHTQKQLDVAFCTDAILSAAEFPDRAYSTELLVTRATREVCSTEVTTRLHARWSIGKFTYNVSAAITENYETTAARRVMLWYVDEDGEFSMASASRDDYTSTFDSSRFGQLSELIAKKFVELFAQTA